jgi:hypothetical protein
MAAAAIVSGAADALGDLRGRRWVDITDEEDAAEAATLKAVTRCGSPALPTLAEFLAVARHVRSSRRASMVCAAAPSLKSALPHFRPVRPLPSVHMLPACAGAGLVGGAALGSPKVACLPELALAASEEAAPLASPRREGRT